jgi:hypothetical protein
MPRPDALIPALDEGQLAALREVGYEWDRVSADPQVWRRALPVDPSLGEHPKASQVRPGLAARLVPAARQDGRLPPIQTTSVSQTPPTPLGRAGQALKRLVFGLPLDASAIAESGCASSWRCPRCRRTRCPRSPTGPRRCWPSWSWSACPACRTRCPVGAANVYLSWPSGSPTADDPGLPAGGGCYIVASEELGCTPGLMAAAGLLIDYVMTVVVSVASGVAAIASAYPTVQPATVRIGVGVIVILLAGNLRGVRQAGLCSPYLTRSVGDRRRSR